MKLRLATYADLPAIVRLGRLMHQESTYAALDYDDDTVASTVADLIDKKQFVVVAEDTNGQVVGGMVGSVDPCWFGRDAIASDLALFIDPQHRGGMLVVRLVKAFVQWSRLAGAKQIRPGVTTGSEQAVALYERMGFTRCGATFLMEGV